MRIVVGNLLRNAAENSPQGAIRVRLVDATLRIEDSGEGFDTVAAARRYTQSLRDSAKQWGGQGLGLFLTRRICERFGWTLRITSSPGAGTVAELAFSGAQSLQPDDLRRWRDRGTMALRITGDVGCTLPSSG